MKTCAVFKTTHTHEYVHENSVNRTFLIKYLVKYKLLSFVPEHEAQF